MVTLCLKKSCKEALDDKKRRLAKIQTEKRKLMFLRRKLLVELENAELEKTEAAILRVKGNLHSLEKSMESNDAMENALRKEIIDTDDDTLDMAKLQLLPFDRSFLLGKKITGRDIFQKHNGNQKRSGVWKEIPKDLFTDENIIDYFKELERKSLHEKPSTTAYLAKTRNLKVTTSDFAQRLYTTNMAKEKGNKNQSYYCDVGISTQLAAECATRETVDKRIRFIDKDSSAKDKNYCLVGGTGTITSLGEEYYHHGTVTADERKTFAKGKPLDLKQESGLADSEREWKLGARNRKRTDQKEYFRVTAERQCVKDSGTSKRSDENFIACVEEGENNKVNDNNSKTVKFLNQEVDLGSRRASLSRKREIWIQENLYSPKTNPYPTARKEGLPDQQLAQNTAASAELETLQDGEEFSHQRHKDFCSDSSPRFASRNESLIEMEFSKSYKRIEEDDNKLYHTEENRQARIEWFEKVLELESRVEVPLSSSDFSGSDKETASPAPIRKAKSEHDIFTKGDEKRGSKRRKVLKTRSGQIVRRHILGTSNPENQDKVSDEHKSNWLNKSVTVEAEEKDVQSIPENNTADTKRETSKAVSQESNKENQMYYDTCYSSLPRSETIDEESIKISERKEWLGRLLEMELHGRQESMKKMHKQKSVQATTSQSGGKERRRSLPAGRLVEEYLHRQAIEIAPAYEQPGDFARLSYSGVNASPPYGQGAATTKGKSLPTSAGREMVALVSYETTPGYDQGKNSDPYHQASNNHEEAPFSASGMVRNNLFVTGAVHADVNKPPVMKAISAPKRNQAGSNLARVNSYDEQESVRTAGIQPKSLKISNVKKRVHSPSLQLQQQHSLDSYLLNGQGKEPHALTGNEFFRSPSPNMEAKSTSEIEQIQIPKKAGIPSIKAKIAAFRNAETSSSPELSHSPLAQDRTFGSALQTSKSLEYKNAEIVKNLETVSTSQSASAWDTKPSKFHIHQNSTAVRRALDIASSDLFEKKEQLVQQQRIDNSRDDLADIFETKESEEPFGRLNVTQKGKKFWESMSTPSAEELNRNTSRFIPVANQHKNASREVRKEQQVSITHDIGAAVLGYDEDYSPSITDPTTPSDLSQQASDTESEEDSFEYLKLVQDDKIRQELEEQRLREREMRRENKRKQRVTQNFNDEPARSLTRDEPLLGVKAHRHPVHPLVKPSNKQGHVDLAAIPAGPYNTTVGGFTKTNQLKSQDNVNSPKKRNNVPNKASERKERDRSGNSKSSLLQREEEEQRRRQMEFEEEQRQRMEERRKLEKAEQERRNQEEREVKGKEEEEAEQHRLLQEKKMEGKRKTNSLRALFEKVY